ncbi:hypothetical protein MPSEU_000142000 [Mayamaea pseudoterrestris]|nr:hypothetical protein MPSEU_000142000 [Mayamaea pseudoterrestris]
MAAKSERQYPSLTNCQITLQSSGTASQKSPIRLPPACLGALEQYSSLPTPYDFALESQILASAKEREQSQMLTAATTPASLQETLVVKMKSITNADESICVSLLESNSYDLKSSVEAYFASS